MFYIFFCTAQRWILIEHKHVTVDIIDTKRRVVRLFVGSVNIIVILRGV